MRFDERRFIVSLTSASVKPQPGWPKREGGGRLCAGRGGRENPRRSIFWWDGVGPGSEDPADQGGCRFRGRIGASPVPRLRNVPGSAARSAASRDQGGPIATRLSGWDCRCLSPRSPRRNMRREIRPVALHGRSPCCGSCPPPPYRPPPPCDHRARGLDAPCPTGRPSRSVPADCRRLP